MSVANNWILSLTLFSVHTLLRQKLYPESSCQNFPGGFEKMTAVFRNRAITASKHIKASETNSTFYHLNSYQTGNIYRNFNAAIHKTVCSWQSLKELYLIWMSSADTNKISVPNFKQLSLKISRQLEQIDTLQLNEKLSVRTTAKNFYEFTACELFYTLVLTTRVVISIS
jgi:hypothetical protein